MTNMKDFVKSALMMRFLLCLCSLKDSITRCEIGILWRKTKWQLKVRCFLFYISEKTGKSPYQLSIQRIMASIVVWKNNLDTIACKYSIFTHKINTSSGIVCIYIFMWSTPKRTCKATSNNTYSALFKPLLIVDMLTCMKVLTPDWSICAMINLCHCWSIVFFSFSDLCKVAAF